MTTRERAISLIDLMTEKELEGFIALFERFCTLPAPEHTSDDEECKRLLDAIADMGEDMFPEGRRMHIRTERENI